MAEIKHGFTSPKNDGDHSDRVQPSHWNANHTLVWSASDKVTPTQDGIMSKEDKSKIDRSRNKLDADITYYVSTTGNDNNNGLTIGTPFLTLQHAIDVASNIDLGSYNAYIQLADGTYDQSTPGERISIDRTTSTASWQHTLNQGDIQGYLIIKGNEANPSNVTVKGWIAASAGTHAIVKDFKLIPFENRYTPLLSSQDKSYLGFDNMVFGGMTAANNGAPQIFAEGGGFIGALGDYAIDGSANTHMQAKNTAFIWISDQTVTLNNGPLNFPDGFATAYNGGILYLTNNTYVGSATGPKYNVFLNGSIDGDGDYPGDEPGIANTGGRITDLEYYPVLDADKNLTISTLATSGARGIISAQHSDTGAASMFFRKSRGSEGSPTTVLNNSNLGVFSTEFHNGTDYSVGHGFFGFASAATGTIDADNLPVEFFVATGNGNVNGSGSPPYTAKNLLLDINGNLSIPNGGITAGDQVSTPSIYFSGDGTTQTTAAKSSGSGAYVQLAMAGGGFTHDANIYRYSLGVLRANDFTTGTYTLSGVASTADAAYSTANTVNTRIPAPGGAYYVPFGVAGSPTTYTTDAFFNFYNGTNKALRLNTLDTEGDAPPAAGQYLHGKDIAIDYAAGTPSVIMRRANNTKASKSAVAANDILGQVVFGGYASNGAFVNRASIGGEVDGTVGSNNVPTAIVIKTGSSAARTEKMRISSAGFIGITLGSSVASADTITPTGPIFHITGVTTINTINVPYTGFIGQITIIPDGIFATSTSGNIALASTSVISKALIMTYDGTKWYPSY